jgi:hypothetical protein
MWILGGQESYYFGSADTRKNDVWASQDGKNWEQVLAHAPWRPRAFHATLVHNGRLWLLGGGDYVPAYAAYNDVWSSEDGKHWRKESEAPWAPRLWFSAVSYRGLIWVMGGWNKERDNYNDVWVSRDGAKWIHLTSEHGWKARHAASAWVFDDKIYIAGGHAMPLNNEVWALDAPLFLPLSLWFNELVERLRDH